MSKYSSLKYKLDVMKLEHSHELNLLKVEQEMKLNDLIKNCTHQYDDGSSAKEFNGVQWDYYYTCSICGKSLGGGN